MRARILDKSRREWRDKGYSVYDESKEGIPISMEDLAGTLSSFGPSPLIYAARTGILPTDQECEDYIALWRVIGYYIGTIMKSLPASVQHANLYVEALTRTSSMITLVMPIRPRGSTAAPSLTFSLARRIHHLHANSPLPSSYRIKTRSLLFNIPNQPSGIHTAVVRHYLC